MNSQRKNAFTSREIVTTSQPISGERNSWSTWYRRCIGASGSKCMTIVSAPIESERENTSNPSTDACRCISRWPEASYWACSSAASSIRVTPTHWPPSNGFMYSG